MGIVAVAGGTGGIGGAIVEELVRQGTHEVLVLSRKASPIAGLSVPVLEAKYDEPLALQKLLEDHKVEIVISAIILFSDESSISQLNLIDAAKKTSTMKTFIPSEYGINYTTDLLAFHPAAKYFLDAADALRASHLNFTRVILGWTLDHYGMPHVQSHMKPFKYVLDFDNHRAALPGDGETPVTFLHSADLAKYVAAMLKQDSWPETSAFVADRMSWKEMVRVAEWVTGNNWNVTYDSIETLHNGEATLFDQPEGSYTEYPKEELRKLVSEFGLMVVNGIVDVSGVGTRNAEFPEIRPVTVEEIIERAWGGEVRHRK